VLSIRSKAEDIRTIRKKVLAHADLHVAIGQRPPELPETTREQYEELVATMVTVMNQIQAHYLQSAWDYTSASATHAAHVLIHALRQFCNADQARRS
jgi:hypothetical protein